jgi:hypothetical protein
MNYLKNINDKEAFKETLKQSMDQNAFEKLDVLKKDMANDFLKGEEEK